MRTTVKYLIILVSLILAAPIVTATTKEFLYSVNICGSLSPSYYISNDVTVPPYACDTCERIVGVRYGGYDYMVVAYNHYNQAPKIAFWIGQQSDTYSVSREVWSRNVREGSQHSVIIRYEGYNSVCLISFIVDGTSVYNLTVRRCTAVDVIAYGIQPVIYSSEGTIGNSVNGNHQGLGSTKVLLLGIGVLLIIIFIPTLIRRR